ncbi:MULTISPECIES: hypothetical protein [Fructobacillus]|jgi:small-conductance mechanosensitive channel|uniref:Uncharacterized protein n=1 Tax=Fructobacillus cardui TaxID=2893170 RepID=A0ABM9N1Z5_9LACO|nr:MULTISPECIES: hypothetical protein [Fructobacillus]KMK53301.1 hypothetical protein FEFB_09750 [Fructobacillus sp. EFB-N1]MCK8627460.1 hypothetical protein [Fructobacillus cardui]CAK1241129.1 hypothetical protein R82265_HNDDMDAM_00770 [Fructobacillus cardui]CAK1241448.1 hypothetical protein R53653_IHELHDKM_01212 [Fructobacillus cardui]CAK1245113.1 hypothetical protein R82291_FJPPFKPJ_01395 [Fructobacillus cardui]
MLGIIGLIIVILSILVLIAGNTAPLLRLYFGDRSVISQIFWGVILFAIGALILGYNALHL